MATTFYLTSVTNADITVDNNIWSGTQTAKTASFSRGAGLTTYTADTVGSGSQVLMTINTTSDEQVMFYTPRLKAASISGTITGNLWMSESSMNANVAGRIAIYLVEADGTVVDTVHDHGTGTELGTSQAAQNFSTTPNSPGSFSISDGQRLCIAVYGANVGTMGSGFTFSLGIDGTTASSNGDSYVTFTENLELYPYANTFTFANTAMPDQNYYVGPFSVGA